MWTRKLRCGAAPDETQRLALIRNRHGKSRPAATPTRRVTLIWSSGSAGGGQQAQRGAVDRLVSEGGGTERQRLHQLGRAAGEVALTDHRAVFLHGLKALQRLQGADQHAGGHALGAAGDLQQGMAVRHPEHELTRRGGEFGAFDGVKAPRRAARIARAVVGFGFHNLARQHPSVRQAAPQGCAEQVAGEAHRVGVKVSRAGKDGSNITGASAACSRRPPSTSKA